MADMTATTMASWVPAQWSTDASIVYQTACVLAPKMDTTWKPLLGVGRGNIANIPVFSQNVGATGRSTFGTGSALTFTATTESKKQLQVNKMAYFGFQIPCEMAKQAMPEYLQLLAKGAGEACSIYVDGQLASDNTDGLDYFSAIGADNVDITNDLIQTAKENLDAVNAPLKDRFFVVSPQSATSLTNIEKIINHFAYKSALGGLLGTTGPGSHTRGEDNTFMGSYLGFDFWMSNNLETGANGHKCAAWQKEAIALAIQQDIMVEKATDITNGIFYQHVAWLSFGHKMIKSNYGTEVDGR